jgi:hypothetical protein
VEHVQGRYLRVIGETKSRAIAIPEGIDHSDQVLETVSSLRPVRVRTIEQWQKYRAFIAAGLPLGSHALGNITRRRYSAVAGDGFGHRAGLLLDKPSQIPVRFAPTQISPIAARRIPVGQRPAAMHRNHPRGAAANAEVLRPRG